MNWLFLVLTLVVPMFQPVVQTSIHKMHVAVQQRRHPPQPHVVYHEGRWWKLENGQWYVWVQNGNNNSGRP